MATATKAQLAERAEYVADLRELLADVDTIYTEVLHVSRSGMRRAIKAFIVKDGAPIDLTWRIARAGIGKADPNHGGIIMDGCGMDMASALVYNLGRALISGEPWACRGERCPSNDHVNAPRMPREAGAMHKGDGGYRFRQSAF